MNIQRSIYYRAKSLVENRDKKEIMNSHGLDSTLFAEVPMEFLEMMETIKNYQKESTILLDIGSHEGVFSKVANAFFPFEKIFCFEPNKELNASIKQNIPSNKLTIENIALSNEVGTATFHLHKDSTMNSILDSDKEVLREEFPWDHPDHLKETTVSTNTLDKYCEEADLKGKKMFIKIDTQGNELNVLKCGINALKQTELLVVEFMFFTPYETDFTFVDLVSFLNENNFDCKGALTIRKRPSKKISAVDFLFVRRKER